MTSKGHDIGEASGFRSGVPYRVVIDNKALVVVRKGDEFYAMRDRCPHAGAPLARGSVVGMPAPCRPGEEAEYIREGEILTCPWHGWAFDLKTGCSLARPEKIRVRSYAVAIENGRVIVAAD